MHEGRLFESWANFFFLFIFSRCIPKNIIFIRFISTVLFIYVLRLYFLNIILERIGEIQYVTKCNSLLAKSYD